MTQIKRNYKIYNPTTKTYYKVRPPKCGTTSIKGKHILRANEEKDTE